MPNLKETFAAIDKELSGLLDDSSPQTAAMTAEQFVVYVQDQLTLAKSDSDPSARISALREVVSLAKAYSWEDNDTMSVPVFSGELSKPGQSAAAERIAEHPGMGLGSSVPQGSTPAPEGSAFAGAAGPSGPASNTASPAARYMPPATPQSEPASPSEGFMAKAAALLEKSADGAALMTELKAMLDAEAQPGDGAAAKAEAAAAAKDEGWPLDLATEAFLENKPAVRSEDDFGADPSGLGRGKIIFD